MLAPGVSLAVQLISILSPSFAVLSLKVPEVNSKRFYKMREEKKTFCVCEQYTINKKTNKSDNT